MYYLLMVIATCIFAANVWVIQMAKESGWKPFFLSLCSYILSALIAFIVVKIRKSALFNVKIWKNAAKPGAILFLANIFLLLAVERTTPERIGFIIGLTVIFVPLLRAFFYHTKIPPLIYCSFLLAFLGNTILNYSSTVVEINWGDIFALLTTICYALSIIWIKNCSSLEIPVESFVVIQSTITALGYIPLVTLTNSFQNISMLSLFPLIFLGIISFILGNALQFIAQKNIAPEVASIILASSSIIGMFIGFFFFGLELSFLMIIAALLFCSASIIGAYSGYS